MPEKYTLENQVVDCFGNEVNCLMLLKMSGEILGSLDYNILNDIPYINFIHVEEKHRKKGIGTLLAQKLQESYPDSEINIGYTTPDGTELFKRITYEVEDIKAKKLIDLYKEKSNRMEVVEKKLNEIYSIQENEPLTYQEQQIVDAYDVLGNEWDILNVELNTLKEKVSDLKLTRKFIFVSKEEKQRIQSKYVE